MDLNLKVFYILLPPHTALRGQKTTAGQVRKNFVDKNSYS